MERVMKALFRFSLSFALVAIVTIPLSCADDDKEESECDSRPADYWENCESQCTEETKVCREDCGPDPSGEPEGACRDTAFGTSYEPRHPLYTEYCECYDACSWLKCVNDCLYPCGEVVV